MADVKLFDMSIQWSGIDAVLNNLDKVCDEVIEAVMQGLVDDGLDLLSESVQNAPIDVGDLRKSAHLYAGDEVIASGKSEGGIDVQNTGLAPTDNLQVSVAFEEPYALKQHEHMEYQHTKGGMAKFLQTPLQQKSQQYHDHIVDKVREVLGG